jgi:hypothetical protein
MFDSHNAVGKGLGLERRDPHSWVAWLDRLDRFVSHVGVLRIGHAHTGTRPKDLFPQINRGVIQPMGWR